MSEKEFLLEDMKINPMKYSREDMFRIIYDRILTEQDLVVDSDILSKRAYDHILRYPKLSDEQRQLPISKLSNPQSVEGNVDVFFFGVTGSGKSCVLASMLAQTIYNGFTFNPRGKGGGGNYALELRNYARLNRIPPTTSSRYIQIIDCELMIDYTLNKIHKDSDGPFFPWWENVFEDKNIKHSRKLSFIEMPGINKNPIDLNDLGIGAMELLMNNNNKVLFFIIDPVNTKQIQLDNNLNHCILQSGTLSCVSSLLSRNKSLMKKVVAIHIILAKSDSIGDSIGGDNIKNLIVSQGYINAIEELRGICESYNINKQTGYHVGVYPFSIGKFMPGDVYEFDDSDSLKILRVINNDCVGSCPAYSSRDRKSILERLISNIQEWMNS